MKIGVLKDMKPDERRVALLPRHAHALTEKGHCVTVERGAGEGAGFIDAHYACSGAKLADKFEVLQESELLLKVKAPLPREFSDYAHSHTLFTYLHFDENIPRSDIAALIEGGFLGIAYEWVGTGGSFPLLEPMSRLTGYLFAQKAVELCASEKGTFCPRNEDFLPGGHAILIGTGNIGLSALKYLLDLNLRLTVIHNASAETVRGRMQRRFTEAASDALGRRDLRFIRMETGDPARTRDQIAELLPDADIIINAAVRRPDLPKSKLAYLIDREMIATMAPGSIVCDATACDRDLIETCVSSPSLHATYREDGVVHYNCDHIPALVARTASELLTEATFPYICELADRGIVDALRSNAALRNGVSCCDGWITHRLSAEKKDLPYRPIEDLLAGRAARRASARVGVAAGQMGAAR